MFGRRKKSRSSQKLFWKTSTLHSSRNIMLANGNSATSLFSPSFSRILYNNIANKPWI